MTDIDKGYKVTLIDSALQIIWLMFPKIIITIINYENLNFIYSFTPNSVSMMETIFLIIGMSYANFNCWREI